jgi:hypothetical protein
VFERTRWSLPLIERREIMRSVLKFESPRIRIADYVEASAADLHPQMAWAYKTMHKQGFGIDADALEQRASGT